MTDWQFNHKYLEAYKIKKINDAKRIDNKEEKKVPKKERDETKSKNDAIAERLKAKMAAKKETPSD